MLVMCLVCLCCCVFELMFLLVVIVVWKFCVVGFVECVCVCDVCLIVVVCCE